MRQRLVAVVAITPAAGVFGRSHRGGLPQPLVAIADASGALDRYRVTANLSFQETGGKACKITLLKVTTSSSAAPAWSSSSTTEVAISIDARGTAAHTLPTVFDAAAADPAAKWQLDVTASDAEGKVVSIAPCRSR